MNRLSALAFSGSLALVSALALAGCGGGEDEANNASATEVDSNVMFEQLGNDASALEAAANAAPIVPAGESAESGEDSADSDPDEETEEQPVLGETSGGDTGGNTVESNITGM